MKKNVLLLSTFLLFLNPVFLLSQEEQIFVTVVGNDPGQYDDITYRSIEINDNVDFSKLLRVYINKSSVVMVDLQPVAIDLVGETITKKLKDNVEHKTGKITPENIEVVSCTLQLLVRKSAFTNREDYRALMTMVNESIWGLQKYYSKEVYGKEYPELNQSQKDKVNNLVPLQNYLALDNTD